ncbi:hypothetical protein CF327_g7765 [Tilletia walkeri]|nr:hypothetical protein CF327_g7765 [Tilletia walkeri]
MGRADSDGTSLKTRTTTRTADIAARERCPSSKRKTVKPAHQDNSPRTLSADEEPGLPAPRTARRTTRSAFGKNVSATCPYKQRDNWDGKAGQETPRSEARTDGVG